MLIGISKEDKIMSKRPNFKVGDKVTWRECDGTWMKSLRERHGDGPFIVYDATWKQYGTPHVKVMTEEHHPILMADNDPWLNSSCFKLLQD